MFACCEFTKVTLYKQKKDLTQVSKISGIETNIKINIKLLEGTELVYIPRSYETKSKTICNLNNEIKTWNSYRICKDVVMEINY